MTTALYERMTTLLEAKLGDELVALDVDRGVCFGFNHVATRVWQYLSTPKSFDELKQLLLDEFAVSSEQCAMELGELLESMVGRGLIRELGC